MFLSVHIMLVKLSSYLVSCLQKNHSIYLKNRIFNYIFKIAVKIFLLLKTIVLALASQLNIVFSFLNSIRSLNSVFKGTNLHLTLYKGLEFIMGKNRDLAFDSKENIQNKCLEHLFLFYSDIKYLIKTYALK